MCLIDKRKVRYADHNIRIYKVARLIDGRYYSPYIDNRLWRVNRVDFTLDERPPVFGWSECSQEYSKGYFHAFINYEDAKRRASYCPDLVVLEGYIPEGTRYAKEYEEICAHKMILNI